MSNFDYLGIKNNKNRLNIRAVIQNLVLIGKNSTEIKTGLRKLINNEITDETCKKI